VWFSGAGSLVRPHPSGDALSCLHPLYLPTHQLFCFRGFSNTDRYTSRYRPPGLGLDLPSCAPPVYPCRRPLGYWRRVRHPSFPLAPSVLSFIGLVVFFSAAALTCSHPAAAQRSTPYTPFGGSPPTSGPIAVTGNGQLQCRCRGGAMPPFTLTLAPPISGLTRFAQALETQRNCCPAICGFLLLFFSSTVQKGVRPGRSAPESLPAGPACWFRQLAPLMQAHPHNRKRSALRWDSVKAPTNLVIGISIQRGNHTSTL